MSIFKKISLILSLLLIFLLVAVTLFNLIAALKRQVGGDACPTVLGIATAVVISGSMEPEIEINDLVIIQQKKQYTVGDIVTYKTDATPVTHRIVAERTGEDGTVYFTTQGDNNDIADRTEITSDAIVGRVIAVLPQFGAIQAFLQRPIGFVLITALLAAFILLPDLVQLWRAEGKERAEPSPAQKAADPALQAQIEEIETQLRAQRQRAAQRRWRLGAALLVYLILLALLLVLAQALGASMP